MDAEERAARDVFFEVHSDLPRQGPGSRTSTERALALARPLPAAPRVLDIGCGPGMQTMDLAGLLPDATIDAVDLHRSFVEEARERAVSLGVADRVTVAVGDMTALEFSGGSFDLIWCEGAAYVMGVSQALVAWRPLLKPGGRLALTEAVWLRDDPPDELQRWWSEGYPAMLGLEGNRERAEECGYRLLGDFVLPETDWWEHYYGPMELRIEEVARRHAGDPVAEAVLDDHRLEIAYRRRYGEFYGYAFFVMTPR